MTSLRLDVRAPSPGLTDFTSLTVMVGCGWRDPKTRWSGSLPGLEADFLATLVSEATSAWLYEETPRDVVRALAGVKRLARLHNRDADFT